MDVTLDIKSNKRCATSLASWAWNTNWHFSSSAMRFNSQHKRCRSCILIKRIPITYLYSWTGAALRVICIFRIGICSCISGCRKSSLVFLKTKLDWIDWWNKLGWGLHRSSLGWSLTCGYYWRSLGAGIELKIIFNLKYISNFCAKET